MSADDKIKPSYITKVKSKVACKYCFQFGWLTLMKGVLHYLYISNEVEYQQLVLPAFHNAQVLQIIHNSQGHQHTHRTITLCLEHFYQNSIYHDDTEYVYICSCCQVVKGQYISPHTQPGLLIANNPMDLLCIDFPKIDQSRNGKEMYWS